MWGEILQAEKPTSRPLILRAVVRQQGAEWPSYHLGVRRHADPCLPRNESELDVHKTSWCFSGTFSVWKSWWPIQEFWKISIPLGRGKAWADFNSPSFSHTQPRVKSTEIAPRKRCLLPGRQCSRRGVGSTQSPTSDNKYPDNAQLLGIE